MKQIEFQRIMSELMPRLDTLVRLLIAVAMPTFAMACFVNAREAQTLEDLLNREDPVAIAADARRDGDPRRGAAVFFARAMACSTCHSVGERVESIGPDLTKLPPKTTDAELVEAILKPSKSIADGYASVTIETTEGKVIVGMPVEEDEKVLVLRKSSEPTNLVTVPKNKIEHRESAKKSIMPQGQVNQLGDRSQFLDLISYLINLREGGSQRARELQPPPDPSAEQIPEKPLPWKPVVQRGEVTVTQNAKYPFAVAMGFDGGTLLFDAQRLNVAALWFDGFLKTSPQNYFGVYWHRVSELQYHDTGNLSPWQFRRTAEGEWQLPEPASTSDPNVGTRFDGYQIGKSSVRLQYRLLVDGVRVTIDEDVRVESRNHWQGYTRKFTISGMPAGSQLSLRLPEHDNDVALTIDGEETSSKIVRQAPLLSLRRQEGNHLIKAEVSTDAEWTLSDGKVSHLTLKPTNQHDSVILRLDYWKFKHNEGTPGKADYRQVVEQPPKLQDVFNQSRQALTQPPLADHDFTATKRKLSPVQPRENVDEFTPVTARYLRFVVTKTTGNHEPGIDELEVYGADDTTNLARKATATASSVIQGYAIHQIAHLNDGQLGNAKSWISGQRGGGWAQLEFPEPVELRKVIWARDRTGKCKDRLATGYRIEVSDDGTQWKTVADDSKRQRTPTIGAIRRDACPGYVMEAIPGPFPTWRPADLAFDENGTMYALAMTEGQVWRARTPPSGQPEQIAWERFASGLYHPTGLAIVDGRIYVAQKPEITELIDRNGDGAADHYRTVATGWSLSTGWHEYCFGLAVDQQKNLWFSLNTGYFWTNPGFVNPGRWRGAVMRVAHKDEQLEVIATGCRVPNGISQGPDGNIFFTDNQGDWIQACKLAHVVPGRFYGHPERKEDALATGEFPNGKSAVWFPYERIRSVSGPVHDGTGGKFGPFQDQLFVGDVGYGANPRIMRVALEKVKGEYQGACFGFIDQQPLGCQRIKFGPDNQLYMASLTSGLTRLAFQGEPPFAIGKVKLLSKGKGFKVEFTKPLGNDVSLDKTTFRVQRYHYLYTGNYGSPKAGQKGVPVEHVELSPDRTELTLTLPIESHPLGMVYELNLGELVDTDGLPLVHHQAWYTVHHLP